MIVHQQLSTTPPTAGTSGLPQSAGRSAYRLALLAVLAVLVVAGGSVLVFYRSINRTLDAQLVEYRNSRRAAVEEVISSSRGPAVTQARELAASGALYDFVANPELLPVPVSAERVVGSLGFSGFCVLSRDGAVLYQDGDVVDWPTATFDRAATYLAGRLEKETEAQVLVYVAESGLYWLAAARVGPDSASRLDAAYDGFLVVADSFDEARIAHIESVTGVQGLQVLPSLQLAGTPVVSSVTGAVVINGESAPPAPARADVSEAVIVEADADSLGRPARLDASEGLPKGDRMADSLDLGTYVGPSGLAVTYRNVLPLAEAQATRWAQGTVASFAAVLLCLVFFVVAGTVVFVRPMTRLSTAVSSLAHSGRWVHPRLGYREFGNVADALSLALDRMHRAETQLLGAQERLERRVQERTAELAAANLALADSEDRYRAVVEDLPVLICRMDASLRVTFVNQAYCRYFAVTADSLAGTDLLGTLPEDVEPEVRRQLLALTPEQPTAAHELRATSPDGRARWMRWSVRALIDAFGQIVGYQAVGQDTTEHRELEEQLRQAQKMETIGRLAGGVAHDFNNIVTAIMGHATFALEGAKDSEAVSADIREVLKSAERARKLTQQLLAFSRRQMIELRLINLNELIFDMDRMLRRLIGENITLVTVPGQPMGSVRADHGQVEQVLVNLVVNARDAMPDGGTLTVETQLVDLDESYQTKDGELKPGRFVMLAVSDTGSGMDAETQSHLFEPFFTTKEVGRGTGLGLATVYGIVKQHGGHVWVYSELGKGSVFKVFLPLAQEPQVGANDFEAAPGNGTDTGTVLVVEDDAAVRLVTTRILATHGYQVIAASAGDEALRLADEHPRDIDVLVTDVVMPQMSGRELALSLRQRRPDIAIVYVSGYSHNDIHHHGVLDEGVDFLQKPFTEGALVSKVRAAMVREHAAEES